MELHLNCMETPCKTIVIFYEDNRRNNLNKSRSASIIWYKNIYIQIKSEVYVQCNTMHCLIVFIQ